MVFSCSSSTGVHLPWEEDLYVCSFTLSSSSSVSSSQCLESPCPSPRRAAKHPFCSPNPLGMLLSQVSSKVLRASGALEVLGETCSSRTAVSYCLSAPKDDTGGVGGHLN